MRGDASATGAVADALPRPLDIVWTYDSKGSAFEATAAIVDGIVYVGDVDGTFHAVKLADGQPAWTRKFEDSGFIAGTAVAEWPHLLRRLQRRWFIAWTRPTATEKWKFDSESSLYAAPNVYEGRVLIVTDGGELASLDAETGERQWTFTIDQPLRCWPTVVAGRVLVAGCDGLLHAVDVETGNDLESIDIGGPADGMPAVAGGRVYFCTAGGVFHAAEVKPLKSLWQYGQKGQSEEIHAAAVSDKAVVLGTHDKRVVALGPEKGNELWSFPVGARAESSPVIVGDLAIAATIRGRIHAIELATGQGSLANRRRRPVHRVACRKRRTDRHRQRRRGAVLHWRSRE